MKRYGFVITRSYYEANLDGRILAHQRWYLLVPLELRIFRQVSGEVLKKPALITSSREIYEKYCKTSISSFELSNRDYLKSTSWKIINILGGL